MSAAPAKILLLAIDAASAPLVLEWAGQGLLPALGGLLARGLVGETRSLEGFFVGSTWPSLYTGATPAHHGIHSLVQLRPGTYDFYRCDIGDVVRREPFWNHLSRAGRRVAILDVPLSGISPDLNGIQMVEWGGHDPIYGFRTWPPPLAREVTARFGRHPLGTTCDADARSPEDFVDFAARLARGARIKGQLTAHYLQRGGWDLFVQVFTESHCVGHQCWHLHDPRHPGHAPALVERVGNPLREVYATIDAALGELLAVAGDRTLVLLLIGHGMSYRYGAQFLLRDALLRLGVAAPLAPAGPPGAVGRLDGALGWCWRHAPSAVRTGLRPVRDRLRGWLDRGDRLPAHQTDPRAGLCFLVDNGQAVGGIRLNLAGREPGGLIQPGADERAFCAQLARDLLDLVDVDAERPAVRRVLRTADLYQGECLDWLPDLLVEWNDERPVGTSSPGAAGGGAVRLYSERVGVIEGVNRYCRTGDHRAEGLFVAAGPGIDPGRLGRVVSIMDFAPTLARRLGVDPPPGDGRLIPELLEDHRAPAPASGGTRR